MHRRVLAAVGRGGDDRVRGARVASAFGTRERQAGSTAGHHRLQRRTRRSRTLCRERRGAIRTCRASGPATTRSDRPRAAQRRRERGARGGGQAPARDREQAEALTQRRRRHTATSLSNDEIAHQKTIATACTFRGRLRAVPRDFRADVADRSSSTRRRAAAAAHGRSRESVRHRATAAPSATGRSTPSKTSRSTTAASRAASGLGDARGLRQRQPHRAGAGHGGHQLRDGARHARHLHRWPPAHRQSPSASTSATRAGAGKATSSSSRRPT